MKAAVLEALRYLKPLPVKPANTAWFISFLLSPAKPLAARLQQKLRLLMKSGEVDLPRGLLRCDEMGECGSIGEIGVCAWWQVLKVPRPTARLSTKFPAGSPSQETASAEENSLLWCSPNDGGKGNRSKGGETDVSKEVWGMREGEIAETDERFSRAVALFPPPARARAPDTFYFSGPGPSGAHLPLSVEWMAKLYRSILLKARLSAWRTVVYNTTSTPP